MGERASQAAITQFWNAVAPHYENHPGNTEAAGSAEHALWSKLYQRFLPEPPADVLDISTGTGFGALICAAHGHRVVGVDLAPEMLRFARRMATERGLSVEFVEGDSVEPAFDEESFDVISCRYALWTLPEAVEAVARWYLLLRPGGHLLAIDAFKAAPAAAPQTDQEKFFSQYYTPEVRASLPFIDLQNETALLRALEGAGFGDIDFELLPAEFEDPEEEHRPYVVVAYRPNEGATRR